jgi:hypothetical protein
MILVLLLDHKATRVILEIKEPKAIRVFQVMMVHQAQTVLKAIQEKLAHVEIQDYRVPMVLKEIKANPVNLVSKENREFLVSKVNKEFPVFRDKVYPQAGLLGRYWPNYLVTTMTQDGLINLVILTD